jgi:hypothetical protein
LPKNVDDEEFQKVIELVLRRWVYLDSGGYRDKEEFDQSITIV